jgi:hypothetical protein
MHPLEKYHLKKEPKPQEEIQIRDRIKCLAQEELQRTLGLQDLLAEEVSVL